MTHTYQIHGMTCDGCSNHVEQILSNVKGITKATVDLEKGQATIEMTQHIPLETFQKALQDDGGRYSISMPNDQMAAMHHHKMKIEKKATQSNSDTSGSYYCPMHCEGDKTYNKPGDCPVCGMDLVAQHNLASGTFTQWTCPMHPEIIKEEPGACPICGMDLVPLEPNLSAEDLT